MKIIDVSLEDEISSFTHFYLTIETNHGKYQIDDYGFCTSYEFYNDRNDQKQKNIKNLVGNLFFVNINKSCISMNIDELKSQSDLLEKALIFLKKRMKENIYNGEPESKIQKDAFIKNQIENFISTITYHIKCKERIILEKLKKYNLD